MEGICAGHLGEKGLLLISGQLALVQMCLEGAGRQGLVQRLHSPLGSGVYLTGVNQCWWATAHSLISRVRSLCPHRLMISHPSFVLGFHRLPTFTLFASRMSPCQVAPPSRVLPQAWLCFKAPTIGPTMILWERMSCSCDWY